MANSILKLQKKYTNVLDLHGAQSVSYTESHAVDLRHRKVKTARERYVAERERQQSTLTSLTPQKTYTSHNNYFSLILKSTAILLVTGFSIVSLLSIGSTLSIFNDIESSEGNLFESGLLDFELELSPFNNLAWTGLTSGTSTSQDIDVLPNPLSNPFFYHASSTNFTGDNDFCNGINVKVALGGPTLYDGPLTDFLSSSTTVLNIWNLEFSTNEDFVNAVCHFDIDFNGWQVRHGYPLYDNGFSDTEKTRHWLYSPGIRINKVYFEKPRKKCEEEEAHHDKYEDDYDGDYDDGDGYDGDYDDHDEKHCKKYGDIEIVNINEATTTNEVSSGSSTGGNSASGGGVIVTGDATSTVEIENSINENIVDLESRREKRNREWVELYNQTGIPVSLDGWFLCDAQECDELSSDKLVPPNGFALIIPDRRVLRQWEVPEDFVVIVIEDGTIGDGLHNDADALFLRRPDSVTIDQVNWGEVDESWPSFVDTLWMPGTPAAPEGSMIARIPTGFDTNEPSDWQIITPPKIKLLYPGYLVSNPWYWDYTYIVSWEAEGCIGSDGDLLIDIILIRDTNYNYRIDKDDERIVLKMKTENDGEEEVTIPDGFIGNIWIRLVGTCPVNPMAHDFDTSGQTYCSFPNFYRDDKSKEQKILDAVYSQMEGQGESEYSALIPDTDSDPPEEEDSFHTATSTVPEIFDDGYATTTPEKLENATSTEEVLVEETDEEPAGEESPLLSAGDPMIEEDELIATSTEDIIVESEE